MKFILKTLGAFLLVVGLLTGLSSPAGATTTGGTSSHNLPVRTVNVGTPGVHIYGPVDHPQATWLEGTGAGNTPDTSFINAPLTIWNGTPGCYADARYLRTATYTVDEGNPTQRQQYSMMIRIGTLYTDTKEEQFDPTWTWRLLPKCATAAATNKPTITLIPAVSRSAKVIRVIKK